MGSPGGVSVAFGCLTPSAYLSRTHPPRAAQLQARPAGLPMAGPCSRRREGGPEPSAGPLPTLCI